MRDFKVMYAVIITVSGIIGASGLLAYALYAFGLIDSSFLTQAYVMALVVVGGTVCYALDRYWN